MCFMLLGLPGAWFSDTIWQSGIGSQVEVDGSTVSGPANAMPEGSHATSATHKVSVVRIICSP